VKLIPQLHGSTLTKIADISSQTLVRKPRPCQESRVGCIAPMNGGFRVHWHTTAVGRRQPLDHAKNFHSQPNG
jgi:hypothetical protein